MNGPYRVELHPNHPEIPQEQWPDWLDKTPCDCANVVMSNGDNLCTVYTDNSRKVAEKIVAALHAYEATHSEVDAPEERAS